jgi:hypothetical protein
MKDLIKSLPAVHELAAQAGVELPLIFGKVGTEADNKNSEISR